MRPSLVFCSILVSLLSGLSLHAHASEQFYLDKFSTDKSLYKPSETVRAEFLVRSEEVENVKSCVGSISNVESIGQDTATCVLEVIDSKTYRLKVSYELPKTLYTGEYKLVGSVVGTSVKNKYGYTIPVEQDKPSSIQVEGVKEFDNITLNKAEFLRRSGAFYDPITSTRLKWEAFASLEVIGAKPEDFIGMELYISYEASLAIEGFPPGGSPVMTCTPKEFMQRSFEFSSRKADTFYEYDERKGRFIFSIIPKNPNDGTCDGISNIRLDGIVFKINNLTSVELLAPKNTVLGIEK